jgi:hypothetical protein
MARNIFLIITRMISTKEEGRRVTFVTDMFVGTLPRPGRPPHLHPTPSVHSTSRNRLLDVACRMRLSGIARSQIPGDNAPWRQADQGWTKVW